MFVAHILTFKHVSSNKPYMTECHSIVWLSGTVKCLPECACADLFSGRNFSVCHCQLHCIFVCMCLRDGHRKNN